MNKQIENAMRTRETAAVISCFKQGIDVSEGDTVQVRPPGHDSGRVGVVIGITYYKKHRDLRYNVMFSNKEAALFSGERLVLVKESENHALNLLQTKPGAK